MTKLSLQGPRLVRETWSRDRGGPIVIELAGTSLMVRVKGTRSEPPFVVNYNILLDWLRKSQRSKS
jgi:hypothetical protein